MKTKKQDGNHLSKKDLAERWGVSVRSVERTRARYGLAPCGFFGRQPEFTIADVERMERKRNADREAMAERLAKGIRGSVVTVKQAKALAAKGGKR